MRGKASTLKGLYKALISPGRRAAKVIHIVESLDRGAVETWLVRMLAYAHALGEMPNWTFYCQLSEPGARAGEVCGIGAQVVASPVPIGKTGAFITALRNELKRGRYDVMHCHHDLMSAVYLAASAGLSIRKRLVHVHNADEHLPTASALKADLLREPMRRVCLSADKVVGISNHSLDTMLRGRPRREGRDVVHYYGVDPAPFEKIADNRAELRRTLNVAENALVLLFGGRITPEKNPVFAVDVLAALARREPRVVGVFAGAGSLEPEVQARAVELGVTERLRLIGWRADLPELMAASDWFILPRPEAPMEGFGLAVVEAQLAGLRMLLSHGVPNDPLLPTAVFRRLSLNESPETWAQGAMDMLAEPSPSREGALAALALSPMDMDRALRNLMALHT